jgi:uncharacterized protein YaaN involved in tellurite resistance
MAKKKSKRTRSKALADTSPLPSYANRIDKMAYEIMLRYVNGTGMTDIRTIVNNSYLMAEEFDEELNNRHS